MTIFDYCDISSIYSMIQTCKYINNVFLCLIDYDKYEDNIISSIYNNKIDVIKYILDSTYYNIYEISRHACKSKNIDIFKTIISHSRFKIHKDIFEEFLLYSFREKISENVKVLIEYYDVCNIDDNRLNDIIYIGVQYHSTTCLKNLLKNVDYEDNYFPYTILLASKVSCEKDIEMIFKQILEANQNVSKIYYFLVFIFINIKNEYILSVLLDFSELHYVFKSKEFKKLFRTFDFSNIGKTKKRIRSIMKSK